MTQYGGRLTPNVACGQGRDRSETPARLDYPPAALWTPVSGTRRPPGEKVPQRPNSSPGSASPDRMERRHGDNTRGSLPAYRRPIRASYHGMPSGGESPGAAHRIDVAAPSPARGTRGHYGS